MMTLFKNINILAIERLSLRTSPLLLIQIATIAILYAAALFFNVVYIQSIGSGIGFFSGLFHDNLFSQSMGEVHAFLLFSSLLPVARLKPKRLTNSEKEKFGVLKVQEMLDIL